MLKQITASLGTSTPFIAEYSSLNVSGSLKRAEKTLVLCFLFTFEPIVTSRGTLYALTKDRQEIMVF